MAGSIQHLATVTTIAADTTVGVASGQSAHHSGTFYVDVTAIGAGDTWQVTARWKSLNGQTANVAQSATFTTTGLKAMTVQAPFLTLNNAMPTPVDVFFDNSVDGGAINLSARCYAMWSD
jgi:hypothetical protein